LLVRLAALPAWPINAKSHWYFSPSGEPETGYYGISSSPKGKKNAPFITYNKRKQLKETGSSGDDQLYDGLSHTRFEYHAEPNKKFGQLQTISNPFKQLSLAYPNCIRAARFCHPSDV
jgi:hypothetical protein